MAELHRRYVSNAERWLFARPFFTYREKPFDFFTNLIHGWHGHWVPVVVYLRAEFESEFEKYFLHFVFTKKKREGDECLL